MYTVCVLHVAFEEKQRCDNQSEKGEVEEITYMWPHICTVDIYTCIYI